MHGESAGAEQPGKVTSQLRWLCHRLGDPAFAVLGEGNAAVRSGQVQWMTATGSSLADLGPDDVVAIRPAGLMAAVDDAAQDDDHWRTLVAEWRVDPASPKPSIEAPMHALASVLTGAPWTAHTHPDAVLQIVTSPAWREFANHPLFPDQVVVCGPRMATLPYVDPGRDLAAATARALNEFADASGRWPRVVLMQNHGVLTLGSSPEEALNITVMVAKAARIWIGGHAVGGPEPMSDAAVERIDSRSDEAARRDVINRVAAQTS